MNGPYDEISDYKNTMPQIIDPNEFAMYHTDSGSSLEGQKEVHVSEEYE